MALGPAARAADPEPASSATPETAPELPHFKPGLWEYRRTLLSGQTARPQVSTVRKCADPTAEIREKKTALEKKNCQFIPLRKREDHYLSSWTCPTPNGPVRFRDVLIAQDLTSYEDVSEMHTAHHVTQQKIQARRLGECQGTEAGATPVPRTPASAAPPAKSGKTTE
jgi:hypothetical protein